ncbi:MAG: hypothetical protein KBT32_09920 [Bacteroidales bacterium]|nr:hypothetical protein [Candidatus Physcocola equi]
MSDSNETLLDVAKAIEQHAKEEDKQVTPIPVGVARYRVEIEKNNTVEQIFLTNKESSVAPKFSDNSRNVYKNTSMGGFLIKQGVGSGTYIAPKNVRYKVEVMTKSTFSRDKNGSINDLEIWLSPSGSYRFATLKSLLACYSEDSKKLEEERKSIKEIEAKQKELRLKREKIQAEAARLAEEQRLAEEEEIRRKREEALAEAKRLEEEERRKEEERQRKLEEMKRLEACINETKSKIEYIKSFVRNDVSLRSQHILDASQEDAKRSNVYNGVPVLIDGGPGTGKTTTTIQRLKFLLSKDALNDYSDLSEREKDAITQPESVDYNWLFFSPNELLLQYLRENMREESLNAKDCNTITIDKFRKNMLRDYKLFTPDTDGPFKLYKFEKGEKETRLINNPKQAVAEFEKFCVEQLKKVLNDAYQLNTSNYGWHNIALQLKAICQKASSAKDMYQVMQIFNSLEDNQKDQIRYEEDHQSALLKDVAYDVRALVLENSEVKNAVQALFEKWNKEKIQISEDQDTDDEDEEEEYSKRLPFDAVLALQLPKLIKALALKKIDTKRSLTKRQNELKDLVGKFIDDESLRQVGNVAWFVKNYASITKGLQRNILSKIPKFYKAYRRTLLEGKTDVYDKDLLAKLINKDGNKHLHKDEVDLLVGFINNILHQIHKRSSLRFEKMTHKYVQAFRNNCKYVIGVDEATDYSLLDYYLIYSFRNVKYSSLLRFVVI